MFQNAEVKRPKGLGDRPLHLKPAEYKGNAAGRRLRGEAGMVAKRLSFRHRRFTSPAEVPACALDL